MAQSDEPLVWLLMLLLQRRVKERSDRSSSSCEYIPLATSQRARFNSAISDQIRVDSYHLIDRIQLLDGQDFKRSNGCKKICWWRSGGLKRKYNYRGHIMGDPFPGGVKYDRICALLDQSLQMIHSICKRIAIEVSLVKAIADRYGAPVVCKRTQCRNPHRPKSDWWVDDDLRHKLALIMPYRRTSPTPCEHSPYL